MHPPPSGADHTHFLERNGRVRAGESVACEHCTRPFVRRKVASKLPQRFCSSNCARDSRKVTCRCATCGAQFQRSRSKAAASKSGLLFCSRACHDKGKSKNGPVPQVRPAHYGTGVTRYRDTAISPQSRCADCQFSFKPLLVVHHIDGTRENNEPVNLEVLCPSHHALRHMRQTANGWKYAPSALTPRDLLPSLQKLLVGPEVERNGCAHKYSGP